MNALSQQIVERFQPERVILFGSYAYGQPTSDSDVDLLVVMSITEHPARAALRIRRSINPSFPVDIIVRSPDELRQRLDWNDYFLREIVEKGSVLYESTWECRTLFLGVPGVLAVKDSL